MVILFCVKFFFTPNDGFLEVLKEILVLTIAAIPIGLPTVMTVTMAVGAKQLAKLKVVVKRLPAIEELASVSILCSDKTGTLTANELKFDDPYLAYRGNTANDNNETGTRYTRDEILLYSYFASERGAEDPIEKAVRNAALSTVPLLKDIDLKEINVPGFRVITFTPFNPVSKFTEVVIENLKTGVRRKYFKGAPHVISALCGGRPNADDVVLEFASRGLRCLGVCKSTDEAFTKFELVGMLSFLDPPRPDSAATIKACKGYGVSVYYL